MNTRIFEGSGAIEITRNTVKFGKSVYQLKNVTGFTVGAIPQPPFPWVPVLLFGIGGILGFTLDFDEVKLLSGIFILIAAGLTWLHLSKLPEFGLMLYLNSGHEQVFKSTDKPFLEEVVGKIYQFMEEDNAGTLHIDISDRSVVIKGGVYDSSIITGNRNVGIQKKE